jgi:lipopolysaccharide heptosyltransferase II
MQRWKYILLRTADAAVGPWLCRHVRPLASGRSDEPDPCGPDWRGRPVPPEDVERILIIRPGGIGDAALTWPMIHALRQHYAGADLDVLAERRNAGVYRIGRLVDAVHCYDDRPLSVLRRLRASRYDIVIDTEQFHHLSILVANSVRPRYLCGFDTIGRGRFQTHRVPYRETDYEVRSFLRLAESLIGTPIPFDETAPFIEVGENARTWAAETAVAAGDRALAVIVPTASGRYKQWPTDRYATVASRLLERGLAVVLLGGSDGSHAAAQIRAAIDHPALIDLVGRTSLPQTAGMLERAAVLFCADTGVLHIACGVGTPTVSLFGPGIPQKWVPRGDEHRAVRLNLPCSPCTRFGRVPRCPYGATCMQSMPADDATMALEEVLGT